MSFQLLISDESRLDIFEAFSWYESRREGLGKDFELCLEAGLNDLHRKPLLSEEKYKSIRIYFIRRFPYGIHYLISEQTIFVLAIFHTSRSPQSWGKRLNDF